MLNRITQLLKDNNIESISGMDATFLYAETPNSPMHISSLIIIEGSLTFNDFKKTIASRIHLIPKLRQRLVFVPMSVDYPYWVDDPNFNLDLHLKHIALPKPGTWKQLRQLTAQIISEPLDRSRPLWSFTFIEGLDKVSQVPRDSVAIVGKTHHVAVDGVSGTTGLQMIFDMSPKTKPLPEPKPYEPKELPSTLSLLLNSSLSFAESPLKLPGLVGDFLKASYKTGALSRLKYAKLPETTFTAPRTPLNGTISPVRTWSSSILSFQRIRKLSKLTGCTINDIILAICSGALRRYLLEKKKLPKKPLVAMVPISTRMGKEDKSQGNHIAQMLVQLATDIEDPIERLQTIIDNTIQGKTYHKALGAKTISELASTIPFGLANQAARVYNRYNLSQLHNPLFNVTITNVPGPPFPLYVNGHKVLSLMGSAPVIDGMGLIIAIISYNGQITISSTSCENSMPDIDLFSRYVRESANELETLILNLEEEKLLQQEKEKDQTPPLEDLIASWQKKLVDKSGKIPTDGGLFQIHLTQSHTHWLVKIDQPAELTAGQSEEVMGTFELADEFFDQICKGELDWQTAVIQGRIVETGDEAKTQMFGEIISQVMA